jgi:hypothetical protein
MPEKQAFHRRFYKVKKRRNPVIALFYQGAI